MNWKERLAHRTTLLALAGGLALGAAAAAAYRHIAVAPQQALVQKRVQATLDLAKLYGLQLAYKRVKGTYADDLGSLLLIDPDGASLKARLAANVDMNTLAVVGDADKFKIELNVLDPERTLIKVKGPVAPRGPAAAPPTLRTQAPPMNADGAPIGR
ncbi:MAG: hypothetical protein ACHQ2Z_14900 [Elusimicrobiota bacterium]